MFILKPDYPHLALLSGLLLAWWGASLFKVAAACCAVVFLTEMVIC